MKDEWYGDNRDLVKWGALLELARRFDASCIIQVLTVARASGGD